MKLIVTRCQVAKNLWLLCSECTNSLPPIEVIGVDEAPPDGAIVVHFLMDEQAVRRAHRDMAADNRQIVAACCVGRDEDIYPTPGTERAIADLRTVFGADRIYHCPEAMFDWISRQVEPAIT